MTYRHGTRMYTHDQYRRKQKRKATRLEKRKRARVRRLARRTPPEGE